MFVFFISLLLTSLLIIIANPTPVDLPDSLNTNNDALIADSFDTTNDISATIMQTDNDVQWTDAIGNPDATAFDVAQGCSPNNLNLQNPTKQSPSSINELSASNECLTIETKTPRDSGPDPSHDPVYLAPKRAEDPTGDECPKGGHLICCWPEPARHTPWSIGYYMDYGVCHEVNIRGDSSIVICSSYANWKCCSKFNKGVTFRGSPWNRKVDNRASAFGWGYKCIDAVTKG